MIKMIAAVGINGVIGMCGKLPWKCPEDLAFFRKMTSNSAIIVGRKTYEESGPLPNRRNIVITSRAMPEVETYESVGEALGIDATRCSFYNEDFSWQNRWEHNDNVQ